MVPEIIDEQIEIAKKCIDGKLDEASAIKRQFEEIFKRGDCNVFLHSALLIFSVAFCLITIISAKSLMSFFRLSADMIQAMDTAKVNQQQSLTKLGIALITIFLITSVFIWVREWEKIKSAAEIKKLSIKINRILDYIIDCRRKIVGLQQTIIQNPEASIEIVIGEQKLNVDDELERCSIGIANNSKIPKNGFMLFINGILGMILVFSMVKIFAPQFDFLSSFNGELFGHVNNAAAAKVSDVSNVSMYGKKASIFVYCGVRYPSIQENDYIDRIKKLKKGEFILGKIKIELNLRKDHIKASESVATMNPSDKFFILGEANGWFFGWYVKENQYGWASKKYIVPMKSSSEGTMTIWRSQNLVGTVK